MTTDIISEGRVPTLVQAGIISSAILNASETSNLWPKYYRSQAAKNPAKEIAEAIAKTNFEQQLESVREIPAGQAQMRDAPILSFMRELISIQRGALGRQSKNESEETGRLRKELRGLDNFLTAQCKDVKLPVLTELPEDYQKLLKTLRHHTGQNMFRPDLVLRAFIAEIAHHIKEEATTHKKTFGTLLATCIGAIVLMNTKGLTAGTNFIDPRALQVTDLSLDALTDPNYNPNVDISAAMPDMSAFAHDHLYQLINIFGGTPEQADHIRQIPGIGPFVAKHSFKTMTLASDAQDKLNGAFDFWNGRIAPFIKGPSDSLSNMIGDLPFKTAFNRAAENTANGIYWFNTFENMLIHFALFVTGVFVAARFGSLTNEEAREGWNKFWDFARRTVHNSPLRLAFGGAATAYALNTDFSLGNKVWIGVLGAFAGEGAHKLVKLIRKSEKQKYVANSTSDARIELANFANVPLTDKEPGFFQRFLPGKKTLIVGGGLVAAGTLDIAFNNAVGTGYVAGAGTVLIPFLGFNIVEDTSAHIIFGAAGATLGFTFAMAARAGNAALAMVKQKTGLDKLIRPWDGPL